MPTHKYQFALSVSNASIHFTFILKKQKKKTKHTQENIPMLSVVTNPVLVAGVTLVLSVVKSYDLVWDPSC